MLDKSKRSIPFTEKLVAVLLCKGDLSHEEFDAQPCSTAELFRFASARHKILFAVGILCAAVAGLLMPINQILSGLVAHVYLNQPNATGDNEALTSVIHIVYIYAAGAVVQLALNYFQQHLLLTVTNSVVDKLRREYVSAVQRLDAQSLDATSPGKLSAELSENIDKIRDGLGEKLALVVRSTCIFMFSIVAAFVYNWKVSLVLLPIGPVGAVLTGLSGKFSARSIKQQMDTSAKGASLIEESVMNVKTVAACNGQEDVINRYRAILDELIALGSRVGLINGFFEGSMFFVMYGLALLSLLWGVPDTFTEGGLSAYSVIVSFGCIMMGSYFLGLLGPHMMTLLKARTAAAIIYETIDKAATLDGPSDEKVARLRGDIVFHDVRFKYETRDTMVLQGLSWSARAGQAVAFAGHSGCGKSTSIGLLTKLYEKCGGKIFVDGKDIAEENILLGRKWEGEGSTEKRLAEVAGIAQAASFIEKLEHGFDTVLGEFGIALSGGQKQRIAIARAIFMDPPILILDEATSALDVQSERLVQAALNEASVGRTTISIAHRLSTLKEMDVIYVVDKGVVIEQGNQNFEYFLFLCQSPPLDSPRTHDELLNAAGTYAKMAERQSIGMDDSSRKTPDPKEEETRAAMARILSTRRSSVACSKRHKDHPEDFQKLEYTGASEIQSSSFFRIYSHGHLSKIIPAFIFSSIRGLEIPGYTVLMSFLYTALNSSKAELWPSLETVCCFSFAIGVYVWTTTTLAGYFTGKASESVIATVKERILDRVLHRNAEYFDHPETSNATIVNDINKQPGALLAGLDGRAVLFTWCSTTTIVCDVIALVLCWHLGLIAIASTVLLLLGVCVLFIILTGTTVQMARVDRSAELALEIFSQTRTIQMMAVEHYFESKYVASQEAVKQLQRKAVIIQSAIWALSTAAIYLFGLISFGFGAPLVYDGVLTGQELFVVDIAIELSAWGLAFINPTFPDLVRANAAARILYAYFDLPLPNDSGDSTTQLSGAFAVRNVTFSYPTRPEHKVARSLAVSAAAGDSIALVGPSGCGKSTLISLFERFYDQQEGTIKFDDIDHRQMTARHLRKQIALVGQDPVLFQGSIADNILLGTEGLTIEHVREACRMANAANFIESLPDAYNTDVGARGRSLSGGQKQRIAIARALVRNPKILLLDEATSALDGESEMIVQEAIARASVGRTSVSIAHRLATIKDATRIYFIEDGSVVECGNHEELIHQNGKYAAYVKAQSLGSN
ncbi:hypothetical protein PRIPAC_80862 [Pristionchus pacificus]|uniref:ABC transporter ATP-binding protein n=1 Tax=Pristionchus pacificus TaxID=54126 RepID=A0A2A6CKP8_PRIPA|nr:hypothetical protein PRIPAC_80862 [Pristionchus pacificus]|eukprot:PDM78680.1 ABC transporter ATP-binding protein [Pristionchus pacificus]